MKLRLFLPLLLAAVVMPAMANDALWRMLQMGPDLVVLMRHTQSSGGNPVHWDESGHCQGESRLTDKGLADARRIGQAFAQRGIQSVVISSPMCRCTETARAAFGTTFVTDASLREIQTADSQRAAAFEKKAHALIAQHRGPSPLIFVSHRPNIDLLILELMDEGELLVAQANEQGQLTMLGKFVLQP